MALFGLIKKDPNAKLSGAERMQVLGATLRDVGASLNGGEASALSQLQAMLAAGAQRNAKTAFGAKLSGMMGPQYQDGPAINFAPKLGGFVPDKPATPIPDAPFIFSPRQVGGQPPGPSPLDQLNFGTPPPQIEPEPDPNRYAYQPPQKLSDGLSIRDPRLTDLAMEADAVGYNMRNILDILKARQPSVKIGPDGTTYDEYDPLALSRRFRNPTNVNGWIKDLNNPENENTYSPNLPEGMIPDGKGGVTYPNGLVPQVASRTGAEALARGQAEAQTSLAQVQGPGGVLTGPRSAFLNGVIPGQTPGDTRFDQGIGEGEVKRYEGLIAAGQSGRSMEANLLRMQGLLQGLATGKLTPVGKELNSLGASLGVKIDPKWGNVEAADAIANKLVLDVMGGSLGAGFSNADRDFARSMGPQTAQTAQGRAQIIDFALAKAKRDQQVAGMARQWNKRFGRLDRTDANGMSFYDYLDRYAEANPLVPRK